MKYFLINNQHKSTQTSTINIIRNITKQNEREKKNKIKR